MLRERTDLVGARRLVVKVGTTVVSRPGGDMALGRVGFIVEQLDVLRRRGVDVVLVSSGAVGLGARRLGWDRPPRSVVDRQACAAVGQSALMGLYSGMFERLGRRCAQILLTEEDFHHRNRFVNVAATVERLLSLGVVPIVNENDTVSTTELVLRKGEIFGDNDRLSALVACGIGSELLVLLSDVDGLYTGPPERPGSRRVSRFEGEPIDFGAGSAAGRGGMGAKVEAARLVTRAGVAAVIASGLEPTALLDVVAGKEIGTFFPALGTMNRWRRWLAFATVPQGRIHVNEGARDVLVRHKASLLPAGVVAVEGDFDAGAVVSLWCDGAEFGRGRCALAADVLRGGRFGGRNRAIIRRENAVLMMEEEETQ